MVASTDILFFSSRRNRPFQNAALCTGNGTLMGNPMRRMANANCRTPNATCTLRNLSYATQIVVRDLTRTLRNSSYATQLVIRYATCHTLRNSSYATQLVVRNLSYVTQLVVRYATRRSLRNSSFATQLVARYATLEGEFGLLNQDFIINQLTRVRCSAIVET